MENGLLDYTGTTWGYFLLDLGPGTSNELHEATSSVHKEEIWARRKQLPTWVKEAKSHGSPKEWLDAYKKKEAFLRTKDFKPCKRDVQEQLKKLLQHRPDKIRTRGHTTKIRLQALRECNQLRKERQRSIQHNSITEVNIIEEGAVADRIGIATSGDETVPSIPEPSNVDWSWIDLGLNDNTSLTPEIAPNTDVWFPELSYATVDTSHIPPPLNDAKVGLAIPLQDSYYPDFDYWIPNLDSFPLPPSINDLPLLNAEPSFVETNICLTESHTTSASSMLCSPRPDSPTVEVKIASSHAGSDTVQDSTGNLDPKKIFDLDSIEASVEQAASVLGPGGKSSRASILTISSLRKRLSLKYSDSYLGDVLSLMQDLTIAGSSAISARATIRRMSKALSTTVTEYSEAAPALPAVGEISLNGQSSLGIRRLSQPDKIRYPCLLPGVFPTYCWAQLNNNRLRKCSHGIAGSPGGPNCRPTVREQYRSIRSDVFSHIVTNALSSFVVNEVDTFGNSGVHIAAACKHPRHLLALKSERSRINQVNNAGQTFLHLVREPSATNHKELCDLLKWLSEVEFDFNIRDDHGQTALHILTRPWIFSESLDQILDTLLSSNILISTARDNLGYTIKEQLEQAGCSHSVKIRRLVAEAREPKIQESHCLPNYGQNSSIETVEDLILYAQHAELLRDIRTSLIDPLHEDTKGRNGLHCLAEVSLGLPLRNEQVRSEVEVIPPPLQTQREHYLEGLIQSRVDTNNHDKQGFTPLMSFIMYERANEDDALTTCLLQLLVDAKANVNARNRQGETPLHLAVKLGRRAATKFLLSHGANVHARNSHGLGVIALGEAASKKAKDDETLYAQIILCISLVVNAGGVSAPTILQEWGSPQWRIFDGP
ncbi:hypothetical protein B0J14DRAFT_561699 [Halenospora varia]|nr:hypothetical protein B0J14DRAFT_561699 [Halenospora varia]